MKIRIKGNSLRYRLTQSDLAALAKNGYLKEQTEFIGQPLTYDVQISDASKLTASYIDHTITLYLSAAMVTELADTDRVGFEDKTSPLNLLIEKDFTCLDNVEEDQSDHFPNPKL